MALLPVQAIPNVTVLGPPDSMQQRLAIFSFVVHTPWAKEQLLHHSFVCAVLNDVYGIQVSMG
jgi:selenocysteine lyase/cysteine desulfurase